MPERADDGSVEALSGLPRLTKLDLISCPVTDRCLEKLARLTTLQSLTLSGTKIEGPGLTLLDQFSGVARRDGQILVRVNPSQYVEEVEVVLAETGSSFRVPLADWEDWVEGEWFDACGRPSTPPSATEPA